MYTYKMRECMDILCVVDKCIYYHEKKDRRRDPRLHSYGFESCPLRLTFPTHLAPIGLCSHLESLIKFDEFIDSIRLHTYGFESTPPWLTFPLPLAPKISQICLRMTAPNGLCSHSESLIQSVVISLESLISSDRVCPKPFSSHDRICSDRIKSKQLFQRRFDLIGSKLLCYVTVDLFSSKQLSLMSFDEGFITLRSLVNKVFDNLIFIVPFFFYGPFFDCFLNVR